MRVTKYVHSCLLLEHEDKAVLIDPGNYSWPHINVDLLPELDAVLITHSHADHFYPEAINQLRAKQPELPILSNAQVYKALAEAGIETTRSRFDWVEQEPAKHPLPPWGDVQITNTVFHVFGLLTDPGDSHDLKKSCDVLALPITAPWGSMMDAVKLGLKLKPKVILPIHDYHWHDEARGAAYANAQKVFGDKSIEFVPLETGISAELAV